MEQQRYRVASAERVRELLDSAFASRYHDVREMLALATTAVELAEEKSEELPGDLVVAAWTEYGNALRLTGRYDEAEGALKRAASLPALDRTTRTKLLEVTATLNRILKRFDESVRLLTLAIEAHRAAGDAEGEARACNLLGITYFDAGDLTRALLAYQNALDLLGPGAPVEALTMTGHNLVESMIADGRLSEAALALAHLEPYYRHITSPRLAAKAEWARARLYRQMGQLQAAHLSFERACQLLACEPGAPELQGLVQEKAELEALIEETPDPKKGSGAAEPNP